MKNKNLTFALFLLPVLVQASQYEFADRPENEGAATIPVCIDFMTNLKVLGEPPMVCDRKFSSELTQFESPHWKSLDAWEYRDLVLQIYRERYKETFNDNAPYVADTRRAYEGVKRRLKEDIDSGNLSLSITTLPIRGKPMDVLRIEENKNYGACDPVEDWNTPRNRQHYVVDLKNKKIDFEKTDSGLLRGYFGGANDRRADIFLYYGVVYSAVWGGGLFQKHGLIEITGDDGNFCQFEFNADSQKGEGK